jgi:hypothetical protein
MAKYDDMSFGKAFAAARKEKGAGKTFTWKGNSYTTDRADDKKKSSGSSNTDSVVDRARKAIDRAEGEKPMRPVARPKRDMSQEPTAKKVETPKVTTSELPPARTPAEMRGPAGSPRGPAKGTPENVSGRSRGGFTFDQWREMTRKERKDAGLPTSITGAQFYFRASKASGMAKGGMVKSGYAKGGMIKANCGASMKPTQKGTKK